MFHVNTDFNNICRICVQEVKDAIDLFSDLDESKDVLNKLQLCFQIIFKKDYLPGIICNYCLGELNAADKFRVKCITSEERFLSFCKKLSENIKDEVKNEHFGGDYTGPAYSEEFEDKLMNNTDDFNNGNNALVSNVDIVSIFKCPICERSFKKSSSLLRHNISMHQNRTHVGKITGYGATRRYHCTKCSYSTPYSQTLVTHIRRHTGEKPYICECGKRFADASSFGSHRKIHSNITYFTCTTCGKQFKVAKALRQHLRCHERGKFSCEICQKVLKSRQTLRDHTRRHYNIRNFNCEDCGDTFVTSSELIHHQEKHKTEKNLECHLCGYKTLRRRNLIVHLQRHANDRPYKCELCDTSFYTRQDVRRHQRVHTRNKAYICPICSKGFTRKLALSKHTEITHGTHSKWKHNLINESLKLLETVDENFISENITEAVPSVNSELADNVK